MKKLIVLISVIVLTFIGMSVSGDIQHAYYDANKNLELWSDSIDVLSEGDNDTSATINMYLYSDAICVYYVKTLDGDLADSVKIQPVFEGSFDKTNWLRLDSLGILRHGDTASYKCDSLTNLFTSNDRAKLPYVRIITVADSCTGNASDSLYVLYDLYLIE